MNNFPGYHGVILEIDLTTGTIEKREYSAEDVEKFVGGRGLGMKILWDRLSEPGINPLSPENPLMFMPGPFSGFPIPSASRTTVVTKSPHTSPLQSDYSYASTVCYSSMGGFFGPEIRFAGYDGIVVIGKAPSPVYIMIDDDEIEIRDAQQFWGMKTDEFDKIFIEELGDQRFKTCYIGPAGENLVEYACIINTAARAAGRGGTGCVMGSKNLKAIAIRGSQMPETADHKQFLEFLEKTRNSVLLKLAKPFLSNGTASGLELLNIAGGVTVKNYREGTFPDMWKIGARSSRKNIWVRDFACYCCPIACKKSGILRKSSSAILSHDSPEYETGTMFGANLLISDLDGLLKAISAGDDYGLDIVSTGNVIGFLMEAYEEGYINKDFLDGIDLTWGNVDAVLHMIEKIAKREGIGDLAARGVKELSQVIGSGSERFAIHSKGLELAAWNVHVLPKVGLSYATSGRGACHMKVLDLKNQNFNAIVDSLGLCIFAALFMSENLLASLLSAITGFDWTTKELIQAGERIINLEKMFNYREGFRRIDDSLPERFFQEPLTVGPRKGAVLDKERFNNSLDEYYDERGWDLETSKPKETTLEELGLAFTLEDY